MTSDGESVDRECMIGVCRCFFGGMVMTTTDVEKMYNRDGAARRLGMSRATFDRKRYAGLIEEVRLGAHKIRFTEEALQQYILNNTRPINASNSSGQMN